MKKITLSKLFGGALLFGAMLTPTFALNASSSSSVSINGDGLVKIMNAEVTSVSGNIINALVRFKNSLTNLTVSTNATTTVANGNSTSTSTASIVAGDRIDVVGTLASLGTTMQVNALRIVDVTGTISTKTYSGVVQSVNTANNTFVLKSGEKTITVQANTGTTFKNPNSTTTVFTLATLPINGKVAVTGTVTGANTLTASTVTLGKLSSEKSDKQEKKDKKQNHGSTQGNKNGWKAKEDRTNDGEHKGFLKFNFGIFNR